jgi:integrase/recombinase XerD
MYTCGLRIHEAISLRPEQIDARRGTIRIIGKGNKERLLPLPPSLLIAMRRAWKTHGNRQWVFATRPAGRHMGAQSLRRAFNAACAQEGICGHTPHSLRHGFATGLLERGVEVRIVQILLGHANIRSTEIYTHLTEPLRDQLRPKVEQLAAGLA